ncbi:MAG: ABC transporter permease [Chloroflexota bacterium]
MRGEGALSSWLLARIDLVLRLGLLLIIIIAAIFFTIDTIPQGANISQATFISGGNLQNIARQMAVVGVIAVGETFVIVTAGIDLSVGALLGICGVLFALQSVAGWPIALAMIIALAVALVIGLINGLLVSAAGIPPFIVTLGFLGILRGGAYLLSSGQNTALTPDASTPPAAQWAGSTYVGIPTLFVVLAVVGIVAQIFLRFTRRGRYIYAQGSNPEAARLAGVNVRATLLTVYALSGLLAGVAGIMLTLRLNGANPNNGLSYELDAIAAAVLGGASLFGAKGSIVGTFLGVVLINVLANGIDLINVDPHVQQVIEGALLIFIVWIDQWRKRRLVAA